MTRTYSNADPEAVRAFAIEAARTVSESKCTDVVLLDVRGHSQVCDYVIVGSGTSQRQMRSVAQEVEDLGKARGTPPYRSNRDDGTTWIVIDFVETVIHLFEPEQRLYYDLELLWSGASRVEWRRDPSESPAPRGARTFGARPRTTSDSDVQAD
ncbi:MAG: ribosome silencing factor [Phycisphaerae bacterium]|jgi:ribosome-associated protein|nr:ribosome silencing factor [Phycisphaerae bacterium]